MTREKEPPPLEGEILLQGEEPLVGQMIEWTDPLSGSPREGVVIEASGDWILVQVMEDWSLHCISISDITRRS